MASEMTRCLSALLAVFGLMAAAADVDVVALQDAPHALVPLEELSGTDSDCFDLCHGGFRLQKRARLYNVL